MLNKHKVFLILVSVFLVSAVAANSYAENIKIAFVDLRRALNETNQGKKAMKKLQQEKNKLQNKISKREKEIMQVQKKIKEQQNILSQQALQKKMESYYRSVQELQQSYYQFQQDLAQKEMKATQSILTKMGEIISQIGRSEGYTMIYDRSVGAVVWAPSHLDLTDKLIQKYNQKYPK
jgi:outer membrane protein